MANGIKLKAGYKFINPDKPEKGQVPESVTFGVEFEGAIHASIGPGCDFGDYVSLNWSSIVIGDDVRVGNYVVLKARNVGDCVTIGDNCVFESDVVIESGVAIGSNVYLASRVKVKSGVVIPDHWEIPFGCIVNPGPNGFPVVIPPYPQFHCNVTANRNW